MLVPHIQRACAEQVVRLHNDELAHGPRVTEVWLERVGGENDPHAKAVVSIRAGKGPYLKRISEPLGGNFSHCLHIHASTFEGS